LADQFKKFCCSFYLKPEILIQNERALKFRKHKIKNSIIQYKKDDTKITKVNNTNNTSRETMTISLNKISNERNNFFLKKSSFLNTLSNSNFHVLKCYKLVFNFKNKFQNIGFWLFTFLNELAL